MFACALTVFRIFWISLHLLNCKCIREFISFVCRSSVSLGFVEIFLREFWTLNLAHNATKRGPYAMLAVTMLSISSYSFDECLNVYLDTSIVGTCSSSLLLNWKGFKRGGSTALCYIPTSSRQLQFLSCPLFII